jgi:hypothetical protein
MILFADKAIIKPLKQQKQHAEWSKIRKEIGIRLWAADLLY